MTGSFATTLRRLPAVARRGELVVAAALLSAGAAAIHASVADPHFQEYVPYGVLFVVSALAQAAWAALVLVAPSARLLAVGAVGNGGIVAAWAVSRSSGLPFGPEPWTPEPAARLDIAATAFELGIVAACLLRLVAGTPYAGTSGREVRLFAAVGAAAVATFTGFAFAGAETAAAGHHHGTAAEQATVPGHDRQSAHPAAASAERRTRAAGATSSQVVRRSAAKRAKPKRKSPAQLSPHDATPHAHPAPHTGG